MKKMTKRKKGNYGENNNKKKKKGLGLRLLAFMHTIFPFFLCSYPAVTIGA